MEISEPLQMSIFDHSDTSTSSPGDTLANLSALPGSAAATTILVTSGRKCAALLTRSGRVSSWQKTLLATSRWASTLFLLTWKPTATPQGWLLFRLVPSTPSTGEIASGSWPTVTSQMAKHAAPTDWERENRPEHADVLAVTRPYPTATANTRPNEGNVRLLRAKVLNGELTEAEATQMIGKSPMDAQGKIPSAWPTPKAGHEYRTHTVQPSMIEGTHGWTVPAAVHDSLSENPHRAWPAPRHEGFDAGAHRGTPDSLHAEVKAWATPCATEARQGWQDRSRGMKGTQESLSTQVMKPTYHNNPKLKLHGRWTLALMGFPPDHCDDLPPDPLSE